ncbi:uncharacterized protein ACHE_41027S [Aspergillus chevalieri]|uniref:Macro domain-containing protein n=1 Tax=Aspergillus chevalieri TaxID=182096 RepID=A0A7R7VQX0_ASPCH|nr:uncharacterized protein ACHE_41027S [Aspergillus chevalieri]BCR88463.1 hypothetical protein ACHE_41027S [Aspergillus chevalieri]
MAVPKPSSVLQYLLAENQYQHLSHHVAHQDIWIQLQTLQRLLCIRPPHPPLPESIQNGIDIILQYQQSHKLLTPSETIRPILSIPNTPTSLGLWKGDITTLTNVTAIVNAANPQILGCFQPSHRCIDNVIHSAAGPRLREACDAIMQEQRDPEPVGGVKVTPGFNLPAEYVLHTVGPQMRGKDGEPTAEQKERLASCYRSCLDAMEELPPLADGRKVIAFCCISTGLFAFPPKLAVDIAVDTVVERCKDHPETSVTDVIFDVFAEGDWGLYEKKLKGLKSLYSPVQKPLPPSLQDIHTQHPSILKAQQWIKEADTLIISAGAGLSAATGLDYTSPALFEKYFPAFLPLGLNRLYDVFGFQEWDSPAQKWGYYFNHLNMVKTWPKSSVYAALQRLTKRFESRYFIRTSNADGFFVANGFGEDRITTPQGQYRYLQCFAKCHRDAVFLSEPFLTAALPYLDPGTQYLTDTSKIPRCKYCGGELTLCVRGGDYFNPIRFLPQEERYKAFVEDTARSSNTVILELGAGMNTPVVLRWHDEDLVRESEGNIRMIRAGIGAAGCAPWDMEEWNVAVGIEGGLDHVLDVLIDSPSFQS